MAETDDLTRFDCRSHERPIEEMRYLSPRIVKALQKKGLRVLGYTLNTVADFQQASVLGLKGIITDYPDRLHNFLKQRQPIEVQKDTDGTS